MLTFTTHPHTQNRVVVWWAVGLKFSFLFSDIQTLREGVRMNTAPRIITQVEEGIHRTSEGCRTTGDPLETMAPWGPITTAPSTPTNPHPWLTPVPLSLRNPPLSPSHLLLKELQSRNLWRTLIGTTGRREVNTWLVQRRSVLPKDVAEKPPRQ